MNEQQQIQQAINGIKINNTKLTIKTTSVN